MLEISFLNGKPKTFHLLSETVFCVLHTCSGINWLAYLLTLFAALSTKCLLEHISTFINSDNLSSLPHSQRVGDKKSHRELLNYVPWDDIPWHTQPYC